MRKLIIPVAVVSVFMAAEVFACSCAPPPPPKEALAASSAVFTGKVVAVEDVGDFQRSVTIEVASSWKGVKAKTVTVKTAKDSAACGYGFEKGKSYLVYAREVKEGEAKVLSTNLCSRTRTLAEAKEDLAALGDAVKPE